ncbi:conserved oligomeric Golgi complex subunit 7-like [Anneissia japonica]|uniref:conserved oligomeric Golgi complex subunit 7-like n=1 Tax=Anneissia japonica TaxID=1529436 RepID=UPI001425AFAE|nr:conserved oligomeric Golgi complex subunit 7-like [Anneissia japonica]
MDFSKFLDGDFDAKEWVNAAFKAQKEENDQRDAYAATCVMKLQLFIQEVNNSIEESSQQAIQNLPRVLRDIESVKQEATFLKEQMKLVKSDIQKVEEDTSQSMKMLLEIDNVKSRMQAASEALQQADNWTTLMVDVDEVFLSKDVNAIASKLGAMQQSLSMLAHCGDYEERCQHLETLKNRLEAMLSPQLVGAFNTHSHEATQQYVTIFKDMDRLPQLYNYYHKCHKSSLLQNWKKLQEVNSAKSLVEWLPMFYDHLLATWHAEVQWCDQVFPNPVKVVVELLTQTLNSLKPSLPACMETTLEEDTLLNLIELKKTTDRFAKNMDSAITSAKKDSSLGLEVFELVRAIYSPYLPYLLRYGAMEEEHLCQELSCLQLEKRDLIDCAQLLSNSVTSIFKLTNDAVDRCMVLTNGYDSLGLIQALKCLFSRYCNSFNAAISNLQADVEAASSNSKELGEDWTRFQHALKIIQTCGELLLGMEEFELTASGTILGSTAAHQCEAFSPTALPHKTQSAMTGSAFTDYNYMLAQNPSKYQELLRLIHSLKQENSSIMEEPMKGLRKVNEHAHKFAFELVFSQLEKQLRQISYMEVWMSEGGVLSAELPTFSLSPQEYITKIGQYLMTLPQQLEPFTSQENPALAKALERGRLPFPPEQGGLEVEHLADYWLGAIARGVMYTYVEAILKIEELTSHSTRQLITDIDYLCNVLDAFGLPASTDLRNVEKLLKTPVSHYDEITGAIPSRLCHVILKLKKHHDES